MPKLTTRTLLVRSAAAVALGAGLLYSIAIVNRWTGDWGALLWVCATLFFPWVAGMLAGRRTSIGAGKLLGAAMGALLVLGPLAALAERLPSADFAAIAALFTTVGAANGAMAFPVGMRLHAERPSE